MTNSRKFLSLIPSLLLSLVAFAMPTKGFRHITVDNGLSRNSIYSLLQDSTGLVYIGTWDALHRFDGNEIRELVFTPTASTPTRVITALAEGPRGKIYVGTSSGIFIWDALSQTASELNRTPTGNISQLIAASDGNIHILESPGRHYILDSQTDSIIASTGDTHCLVLSQAEGKVTPLTAGLLPGKRIIAALAGVGNELWVSAGKDGVFHRPGGATEFRKIKFPVDAQPEITKFARYGSEIVMASSRGLWVYNPETEEMVNIIADPTDVTALNDMRVIELMTDREGGLWIGSFFGGINYMSPTNGNFLPHSDLNNRFDGHVVSAITTDSNGNLWLGIEDGGISRYDYRTHSVRNYNSRNVQSQFTPTADNVQGLYAAGDTLYIGMAWGGMDIIHIPDERKIAHFPPADTAPDFPPSAYAFRKGPDGSIYIGTMSGLFRYRPDNGQIMRVSEVPRVIIHTIVSADSDASLWLASQGGGVFHLNGKKWEQLSDSPDLRMAMSVCPTDSVIYVGTEGHGLFRYNLKNNCITSINLGLNGRIMVFSITSDGANLWITTNRGLVAYNPTSGQTIQFTARDGLRSNQFKINSSLRLPDGTIIIGGVNGINSFNPKELLLNLTHPRAIIVECISHGERTDTITTSRLTRLSVSNKNRGLLFRLASSSYDDPTKNRFEFKLEGYDKEWRHVPDGTNTVSYPPLKPGNYVFSVRTSNGNGVFGPETNLTIEVDGVRNHPGILSFLAIVTFLFIAAITTIIHHRRRKRQPAVAPLPLPEVTNPDESADEFIQQLNKIILDDLDNVDLSVDTMASRAGIGRSVFYRKVKAATGQTPNDYLRAVRLNRAAELLRQPGARVNQVCYQTGFSSPSYFSQCFAARFGISPSDYASRGKE